MFYFFLFFSGHIPCWCYARSKWLHIQREEWEREREKGQGQSIALTHIVCVAHAAHTLLQIVIKKKKFRSSLHPLLCPPLSRTAPLYLSYHLPHSPTPRLSRLLRQADAPCDGTPAWEDLVKPVSVSASSAPHSLFLDQTDVRDYPATTTTTTPSHPSYCSSNPPQVFIKLLRRNNILTEKIYTHTRK